MLTANGNVKNIIFYRGAIKIAIENRILKKSRDYAKDIILKMLNAKNKTFLYEEMAFKSLYPTIFEFVSKIKKKA